MICGTVEAIKLQAQLEVTTKVKGKAEASLESMGKLLEVAIFYTRKALDSSHLKSV